MSNQSKNGLSPSAMHSPSQSGGTAGWGIVLAACGLVVTGHVLGVGWLSEPVFGLPAGLWFIGLIAGVFSTPVRETLAGGLARVWELFEHSSRATALNESDSAKHDAPPAGWWPRNQVGAVCMDAMSRFVACLVRAAWIPVWRGEVSITGDMRQRFEGWLKGLTLTTRPIRIGLCMPDEEADALIQARGTCRAEWFRLSAWEDPQSACRKHLFDAVVFHDGEGPVRLVTLERPGHTAGVVEWADLGRELNFGTLFPVRVDPAAIVIEGASRTRVREGADLLRALVEAAAVLARSESRLTLADRMLGRHPTDVITRPAGLSLWKSPRSAAASAMIHLVRTAATHAEAWPEAATVAINAGSAYLIAAPDIAPAARRAGLLAASACEAAGAATALRLGAACVSAMEDDEGMAWFVRADAMIRRGGTAIATLDHAAFLESELAHGSDNPMGVGRAAAGICLVCAVAEAEQARFIRDDMVEEMAYAGWLVGRDQDRGMLTRVFLEIEHARELANSKPARKAPRAATRCKATTKATPKSQAKSRAKAQPKSKASSKKARSKVTARVASKSKPKPQPQTKTSHTLTTATKPKAKKAKSTRRRSKAA